jgi:Ankyrin repeats (3 copies)/Ankyrin repeat
MLVVRCAFPFARPRLRAWVLAFLALAALASAPAQAAATGAELFAAASAGDLAKVQALLDGGLSPDVKNEYGATPLAYASDKGHLEIVKLLLARGATVDVEDTFYHSTALAWAAYNGHAEIVRALIGAGANPEGAVMMAINRDKPAVVKVVLESGKVATGDLSGALAMAQSEGKTEIAQLLTAAGVVLPPPATAEVDPARLARYAGNYAGQGNLTLAIGFDATTKQISATFMGQPPTLQLGAMDENRFRPVGFDGVTLSFEWQGDRVTGVELDQAGTKMKLERLPDAPVVAGDKP